MTTTMKQFGRNGNRQHRPAAEFGTRYGGGPDPTGGFVGRVSCAVLAVWLGGTVYAGSPGILALNGDAAEMTRAMLETAHANGIDAPTPPEEVPPTTGINELVFLMADFKDLSGTKTDNNFESLFFSTGTDSMNDY